MKDINITFRDKTGYCEFGFQKTPKTVEGIEKLVQKVAKALLTTMGSDIFVPELGGNVASYLTTEQAKQSLIVDIDRMVQQMKARQAKMGLPANERLASVSLLDVKIDKDSLDITVLVTSDLGESEIASFPIRLRNNS